MVALAACTQSPPPPRPLLLADGGLRDGGGELTWYKDVLPLTQSRCQVCHQEGGIAPFPLTTYADSKPYALASAAATEAGTMPPWLPKEGCVSLKDSRALDSDEKQMFRAWVLTGLVEGDPKTAPPPVDAGLHLVDYDVSLTPSFAYTPDAGERSDDYHCFILDAGLVQDEHIVAYEVVPGQRDQVHHVLLYATTPEGAQEADAFEPGPGWTCFGGPGVEGQFAVLGGWVPGSFAVTNPAGTGILLPKAASLVMQIHYNVTHGAPRPDETTVRFKFAKTKVKSAGLIPFGDGDFTIPAGVTNFTPGYHPMRWPTKTPVTAYGLLPHMHTRGRRILTQLDDTCLVDIPNWDFHWQQQYFFTKPLAVKKGDVFKLTCSWDNPGPRRVRWGEGTDDEMCLVYAYVTE